jgi:hypothetical protein
VLQVAGACVSTAGFWRQLPERYLCSESFQSDSGLGVLLRLQTHWCHRRGERRQPLCEHRAAVTTPAKPVSCLHRKVKVSKDPSHLPLSEIGQKLSMACSELLILPSFHRYKQHWVVLVTIHTSVYCTGKSEGETRWDIWGRSQGYSMSQRTGRLRWGAGWIETQYTSELQLW